MTSILDPSPDYLEFEYFQAQHMARRLKVYSPFSIKAAESVLSVYVYHPNFNAVVDAMQRIFELGGNRDAPRGLCLWGPTASGKYTAFRCFHDSNMMHGTLSSGCGIVEIRAIKNA